MSFGSALILLLVVAAAGYYLYQTLAAGGGGESTGPSCNSALTACLQKCRRTATEAEAAQACQNGCDREADACKAEERDRR
jgi:hypothetical protein